MERRPEPGPSQPGPGEAPDAHGYDLPPENRPGVPMEAEPHLEPRVHSEPPVHQASGGPHLHRAGIDELTPVYGTAQPPQGASGVLRRLAYQIPEHDFRHWMMLLVADRVDVLEHRVADVAHGRLELGAVARQARNSPLTLFLAAGAAGYLLRRALR